MVFSYSEAALASSVSGLLGQVHLDVDLIQTDLDVIGSTNDLDLSMKLFGLMVSFL